MRSLPIALNVAALVLVCWAQAQQTGKTGTPLSSVIRSTSDKQDWLARARATADDPRKARAVILDGRFGDDRIVIHIAQAYEAAYQAKKSPQRLACFAYAAEMARTFAIYGGATEALKLEQSAMEALLHFPSGAEKGQDLEYFDVGPHFFLRKDNKLPEAWLAYGMYFAGHLDRKRAAEAYQQAIQFDPHFGEAWYALADLEFEPYHGPVPANRIPTVLKQLDRAEKEEPRFHVFALGLRASAANQMGDHIRQIRLLKEAVELMPDAGTAPEMRKYIAQLKKKYPGN